MRQTRSWFLALLWVLPGALSLSACGGEMPGFLGREGDASASYSLDPELMPDPVPVPVRTVRADRGAQGVIVRAEAVTPVQGYYAVVLSPRDRGAPDAGGYITFEMAAIPPTTSQATGPERTRIVHGAAFVPNRALRNVNGIRVVGAGNTVTASTR